MATQVGSIELLATIDTGNYKKGAKEIEKANDSIEKSTDTVDSKGTQAWKNFSGSAVKYAKIASVGIAAAFAVSVKNVANLEQSIGGSEAVFGSFADTIQKKATQSSKVMGTSMNQYLETANKMGSLFQGAGFSVEKSMDLTTEAMQRATDVATSMGISTEMALESMAGAAKGNFTMMDNLGVAMNDTTLNAYALEKGIDKTTQQMTNSEKVGLAMQLFMEKTGKYAGNYAKENKTLSGSFQTLKSDFVNFLAGVEGSDQALGDAIMNMGEVLGRQLPRIASSLAVGLSGLLSTMLKEINIDFDGIAFLEKYKDILAPIAVGIGTIVVAVKAWQLATMALSVAQGILNAVMAANPIGLIILAIAGLVAGLTYFLTQTETGQKIVAAFGKTATDVFNAVVGAAQFAFNWIKTNWPLILATLAGPFAPLAIVVIKNFDTIKRAFSDMWDWIKGTFSTLGSVAATAIKIPVNAIISFAQNTINNFIRAINSVVGTLNNIPGVDINTLGTLNIPRLAEGGIIDKATLAVVGEGREPEAVIPLSKLDKMMSNNTTNSSITINVSGAFATSASEQRRIAQQIADVLKDIEQSRGGLDVRY